MPPSVSLIMTVYNRERYLDAAIKSILLQTYQNFELLIWDDGSTDRSVAVAEAYGSAHAPQNLSLLRRIALNAPRAL